MPPLAPGVLEYASEADMRNALRTLDGGRCRSAKVRASWGLLMAVGGRDDAIFVDGAGTWLPPLPSHACVSLVLSREHTTPARRRR
jgi:hypothetical protein